MLKKTLIGILFATLIVFSFGFASAFNFTEDVPVAFVDGANSYRMSNGLADVEIFKDSAGYNKYYDREGDVAIYDERISLQYWKTAGSKWTQIGIPQTTDYVTNGEGFDVFRTYTDWAGTDFSVTFTLLPGEPLKFALDGVVGSEKDYRLNWAMDGVVGENKFDKMTDSVVTGFDFGLTADEPLVSLDFSDVFLSFGDITATDFSTTAQGRKADIYFNVGVYGNTIDDGNTTWVNDAIYLDPTIQSFKTGTIYSTAIDKVDSDSVVICFRDADLSNYGRFGVWNSDGTIETSLTTFNDVGSSLELDVAMLDSDSFVVAYNTGGTTGYFKIYNIDGTNEVGATSFLSNPSMSPEISVDKVDSDSFVLCFQDLTTDDLKCSVWNISGANEVSDFVIDDTVILYHDTFVKMLDSDSFVVAYARGSSGTQLPYFAIHNIDGTNEFPVTQICSDVSQHMFIELIDSDSFVIAYSKYVLSQNGFQVYNIDGTNELGDTSYGAGRLDFPSVVRVNDSEFVIFYQDVPETSDGNVVGYDLSGSVIMSERTFDSGAVNYIDTVALSDGEIFVAYKSSGGKFASFYVPIMETFDSTTYRDAGNTTATWDTSDEFAYRWHYYDEFDTGTSDMGFNTATGTYASGILSIDTQGATYPSVYSTPYGDTFNADTFVSRHRQDVAHLSANNHYNNIIGACGNCALINGSNNVLVGCAYNKTCYCGKLSSTWGCTQIETYDTVTFKEYKIVKNSTTQCEFFIDGVSKGTKTVDDMGSNDGFMTISGGYAPLNSSSDYVKVYNSSSVASETIQTLELDSTTDTISKFKFDAVHTNSGTSAVSYDISCDGGSNWATGVTENLLTSCNTNGSDFRVKATLSTSDGDDTTILKFFSASLEYANSPPTISSVADAPDPVTNGSNVTFTIDWNDADAGDLVKAHVCKTDSLTAQTCDGGSWVDTVSFSATDPLVETYTTQCSDIGTKNYYVFVCDDDNACSSSTAGTFTVNDSFSYSALLPVDNSQYFTGEQVSFEINGTGLVNCDSKPVTDATVTFRDRTDLTDICSDSSGIYSLTYTDGSQEDMGEIFLKRYFRVDFASSDILDGSPGYSAKILLKKIGSPTHDLDVYLLDTDTEFPSWVVTDTPDYTISTSTLSTEFAYSTVALDDSFFASDKNVTILLTCPDCPASNRCAWGQDTDNSGHSYSFLPNDTWALSTKEYMIKLDRGSGNDYHCSHNFGTVPLDTDPQLWDVFITKVGFTDFDSTDRTITTSEAVTMTVDSPAGGDDYTADNFTIEWTASHPTETLLISCYMNDTQSNRKDNVCFEDVANDGSEICDTTGFVEDSYYVFCNAYDGYLNHHFWSSDVLVVDRTNDTPTITTVTDTPDPVTNGSIITFNVDWDDADYQDVVKVHVCKTDAITGQTCDGGSWADSGTFATTDPIDLNYTTQCSDVGTQNYYVFVCDDSNACSTSTSGTFTVNNSFSYSTITPPDNSELVNGDEILFSISNVTDCSGNPVTDANATARDRSESEVICTPTANGSGFIQYHDTTREGSGLITSNKTNRTDFASTDVDDGKTSYRLKLDLSKSGTPPEDLKIWIIETEDIGSWSLSDPHDFTVSESSISSSSFDFFPVTLTDSFFANDKNVTAIIGCPGCGGVNHYLVGKDTDNSGNSYTKIGGGAWTLASFEHGASILWGLGNDYYCTHNWGTAPLDTSPQDWDVLLEKTGFTTWDSTDRTITCLECPVFSITEPAGNNDYTKDNFDITWSATHSTETLLISCWLNETQVAGETNECFINTTNDGTATCDTTSFDEASYYAYCKVFMNGFYVPKLSTGVLVVDRTIISLATVSVESDISSPFKDIINDGNTDIVFSGEDNMVCRYSTTDQGYSAMDSGNTCVIDGSTGQCTVTGLTQGDYNYHIACVDQSGNANNNLNNLDVVFSVGYTAPLDGGGGISGVVYPVGKIEAIPGAVELFVSPGYVIVGENVIGGSEKVTIIVRNIGEVDLANVSWKKTANTGGVGLTQEGVPFDLKVGEQKEFYLTVTLPQSHVEGDVFEVLSKVYVPFSDVEAVYDFKVFASEKPAFPLLPGFELPDVAGFFNQEVFNLFGTPVSLLVVLISGLIAVVLVKKMG